MAEIKSEETSEKKSLNFIEQIVENDLKKVKNDGKVQTRFRRNPTATFISDMPRPYVWTLVLQPHMAASVTCVLMTPTPPKRMWSM